MSALNIKVAIARRPISNKPRCIVLLASFADRVTVRDAICYSEMGFKQFNTAALKEVVQSFKAQSRAREVNVNIANNVLALLNATDQD